MDNGTGLKRTYYSVFGALLVLTLLTTGIAYADLGPFNVAVALTIAVVKALLVVLFFMHLKHSSHLVQIFAGAGVFWLLILLTFTLSDYLSR